MFQSDDDDEQGVSHRLHLVMRNTAASLSVIVSDDKARDEARPPLP